MLKNRRKPADDSAYNPYECAAQLKELLVESNLSPIMTMVVYEFLSDVIEHKVPRDASIYEYIQKCFEEKLRFVILDTNSEAEIRNKAKAYLILLLEIISHSRFVEGIDIDLYRVKMDGAETSVKVRFDAKNFKVDKRGYEFIEESASKVEISFASLLVLLKIIFEKSSFNFDFSVFKLFRTSLYFFLKSFDITREDMFSSSSTPK